MSLRRPVAPLLLAALATASVAALSALVTASDAHASWPTPRGNERRTALAVGSSTLTAPAVRWKRYLGGQVAHGTFALSAQPCGDVTYLAAADRLRALRSDGTLLWETPLDGSREVVGVSDLDGDGHDEVIATAGFAGRAYVHDAETGALRWQAPVDRYASSGIGVVRLRDVTGDGLDDLYLGARGLGNLQGGMWSDVYSFAADVTAPDVVLSVDASTRDYDNGLYDAFADLDGDGREELVALGSRTVYAYDTDGGALVASGDVGWIPYAKAQTVVADLDGDGDDEVLLFTNASYAPDKNTRHVLVVDLGPDGASLVVRWQHDVGDVVNDRHAFTGEAVGDLDGDGALDVASSFFDGATSTWTTHVWRGVDGALVADVPGHLVGVADVDHDGALELLCTPGPDELDVSAWSLAVGPGGQVAPALEWSLPGHGVPRDRDVAAAGRQSLVDRTVLFDLDGDGEGELVLSRWDGSAWDLKAYDVGPSGPVLEAVYDLPEGVSLGAVHISAASAGARLLVGRTDGYLAMLGPWLAPQNEQTYPTGKVPGLRTGGYFTGWRGVTSKLLSGDVRGDAGDELVVRDGRGALVVLAPEGATLSQPPTLAWESHEAGWHPGLADVDGDGKLEVLTGHDGTVAVRGGASGAPLWTLDVPGGDQGYLTGFDREGDGLADVSIMAWDAGSGDQRYNVATSAGALVWPSWVERAGVGGLGLPSMADFTGDGVSDLVTHPSNWLLGIDGSSGQVLHDTYPGTLSMLPLLADIDGDGAVELVANGFGLFVTHYELGAPFTYVGHTPNATEELSFYQYGALVECASGPRFVYATQGSPRVRVVDPAARALLFDAFLGAGTSHATRADAVASSVAPTFVGNVNGVSDLAGDGEPRLFAGSSDGFLYVMHGCAPDAASFLDYAVDFGAPVGEPIPADVDADGELELVVSAMDGYLYALDTEWVSSPFSITEGGADGDVDDVETFDAVPLAWTSVPGAASYEVAVLDGVGAFVTDGFVDVGDATATTLAGLSLELDVPYYAFVRALDASGTPSFERRSDGFRRVDLSAPAVSLTLDEATGTAHVTASDATGLAAVSLFVDDVFVREVPVVGGAAALELALPTLFAGSHEVSVVARDVGGHLAEAVAPIEIASTDAPVGQLRILL